jgi:hypothetical protein
VAVAVAVAVAVTVAVAVAVTVAVTVAAAVAVCTQASPPNARPSGLLFFKRVQTRAMTIYTESKLTIKIAPT